MTLRATEVMGDDTYRDEQEAMRLVRVLMEPGWSHCTARGIALLAGVLTVLREGELDTLASMLESCKNSISVREIVLDYSPDMEAWAEEIEEARGK